MLVIVDSKEKQPFIFSTYEGIKICVDSLEAGDYTLTGYDMPGDEESVIFERKAHCQELIGNIGAGWDRFLRECELLKQYKHRVIIVCGPDNFKYLYERGFTKLHPNFVYKQLNYLWIHYGIQTLFMPDRETAENYMYRTFVEILRKNHE